MRLLNTFTYQLEDFASSPGHNEYYAVLSHTWADEEILFEDVQDPESLKRCGKRGLPKLLNSCKAACEYGLRYIWIDTCCIDKSSSAELSEAINSMFAYYENSTICFVYLADFDSTYGIESTAFAQSRWFTRGWTLQELLAPKKVEFLDAQWVSIGHRRQLAGRLAEITRIDVRALQRHLRPDCEDTRFGVCSGCGADSNIRSLLKPYSVATRMSWAANRHTTRPEDIAYSLLGLFDIHMPLLYGEGPKAFLRLQKEIIQNSNDQSILAWDLTGVGRHLKAPSELAPSPSYFTDGYQAIPSLMEKFKMAISPGGLKLDVFLGPCRLIRSADTPPASGRLALLNCRRTDDCFCCPGLLLDEVAAGTNAFRGIGSFGGRVYHITPERSEVSIRLGTDMVTVTYDISRFKKARIFLSTSDEFRPFQKSLDLPSVRLEILDTARNFVRRQSVPASSKRLVPENAASFWTALCRSRKRRKYPELCGVYAFDNGQSDGFFVLWGVAPPDRWGAIFSGPWPFIYATDAQQWWEQSNELKPYCSVHSWESVTGKSFASQDSSILSEPSFYTDFLVRLYPDDDESDSAYPKERLTTYTTKLDSGLVIKASITIAVFMETRCFNLTVEVKDPMIAKN